MRLGNILMKLRQINENYIGQKLREMLNGSGYFNRPSLHIEPLYNANSGHDSGARSTGARSLPIGIPNKPRHRKILGFERRPGVIRL